MRGEFTPIPVPAGAPAELGLSGPGVKWCLMVNSGDSGDTVYRVAVPGGQNRWVKSSSNMRMMGLAAHRDRLIWLQGKLPVPRMNGYAKTADREWLATTEVSGLWAGHPDLEMPRPDKVKLLARGLRQIHSIDTAGCPFTDPLDERFARTEACIAKADYGVQARFALLCKMPRPAEDLVFNHGDYCEPNILIQNGKISGFIDLDTAGVKDRYSDFGQACYSLVRNGDGDYIDLFFAEYGMPDVDYGKILYYQDLDSTFWEMP